MLEPMKHGSDVRVLRIVCSDGLGAADAYVGWGEAGDPVVNVFIYQGGALDAVNKDVAAKHLAVAVRELFPDRGYATIRMNLIDTGRLLYGIRSADGSPLPDGRIPTEEIVIRGFAVDD